MARRECLPQRSLPDRVLLGDDRGGVSVTTLTGRAADIWTLLDRPTRVKDIVRALSSDDSAGRDAAKSVSECLQELARADLLEPVW